MKRREFLELLGVGSILSLQGCNSGSGGGDAPRSDPGADIAVDNGCGNQAVAGSGSQPNVLFICIDDLNDWVGVLGGHPQALTPNIDNLAAAGTLFSNAHCAAPQCYPSRTSVLSGLRPSSTGIYTNSQPGFRGHYPELVTMPQHFANNGYHTLGGGRIFDQPDGVSWNDYWPSLDNHKVAELAPARRPANGLEGLSNLDWGPLEDTIRRMGDARLVSEWASPTLQGVIPEPFFMGVGFSKPHLPWYLPPEILDAFPATTTMTPEVIANDIADLPDAAFEFLQLDVHAKIAGSGLWSGGTAAYLAAGYFADMMVGNLLDAFFQSRYADNTILVLWSDNGFHVGEKETWHKQTLWHEGTRIPFIIHWSGTTSTSTSCTRAVSTLDIFPTLIELCGLSDCPALDGFSLVPLMEDAESSREEPAIATMGRGNHAVISEEWRYIRYSNGQEELYDLTSDSNEWTNLADQASFSSVKADLADFLPAQEKAPIA